LELQLVKGIASAKPAEWRRYCSATILVYVSNRRAKGEFRSPASAIGGPDAGGYVLDVLRINVSRPTAADAQRIQRIGTEIGQSLKNFGTRSLTYCTIRQPESEWQWVPGSSGVVGKLASSSSWLISIDVTRKPWKVKSITLTQN